jgi:hypothetical protein
VAALALMLALALALLLMVTLPLTEALAPRLGSGRLLLFGM